MCLCLLVNFGDTESTFYCNPSASLSMAHIGWLTVPKLARLCLRYPPYAEEHGAHFGPSQCNNESEWPSTVAWGGHPTVTVLPMLEGRAGRSVFSFVSSKCPHWHGVRGRTRG